MAKLFMFGFEGGLVPTGVTISTGTIRPFSGTNYASSALVAAMSTNSQAAVSVALGSAKTKLFGSLMTRADVLDYTTPSPLLEFGSITVTLTSSTQLSVFDGTATTTYTIDAVDNGWHSLHWAINLGVTTSTICILWDTQPVVTLDRTISTANDTVCLLRGVKGVGSSLDNIRLEDDGTDGLPLSTINCKKALYDRLGYSEWNAVGTPSNVSSGLNVKGMEYCTHNGMYYTIDSTGQIYKVNPSTYASSAIGSTLGSTYAYGAMVYHKALNRVYFLGNGKLSYLDPTNDTVTHDTQTIYYDGTQASGACYNQITKKAYIVTLTTSGSTNSAAVHIIDSAGSYTVVTDSTYTISASTNVHLTVLNDYSDNSVLFPGFSSYRVGIVSAANAISFSAADGTGAISMLLEGDGVFCSATQTVVISNQSSGTKLRVYEAGSIGAYNTTNTITDAGLYTHGACYHPYLGILLFKATTTTNLWAANAVTCANALKVTSGLPSTATYFTSKINPITNGVLYIDSNVLGECRLLSSDAAVNLMFKDARYLQHTVANKIFYPVAATVTPNDVIASNCGLIDASGTGSISVNGTTIGITSRKTASLTKTNAVIPPIRYVFNNLTNGNAYPSNSGSLISTLSSNKLSSALVKTGSATLGNAFLGRSFVSIELADMGGGGYRTDNYIGVSVPAASLTGDFSIECWSLITGTNGVNTIPAIGGALSTYDQSIIEINANYRIITRYGVAVGWNGVYATGIIYGSTTWTHFHLSRSGSGSNNVVLRVNGVTLWSTTDNSTISIAARGICFTQYGSSGGWSPVPLRLDSLQIHPTSYVYNGPQPIITHSVSSYIKKL